MTSSWTPDASGDGPEARAATTARPAYRPPIGVPVPRERRLVSTLVSVALHALVVLVLLAPAIVPMVLEEVQGAGGDGPAGGGGGGTLGTGGGRLGPAIQERLHYIQVAPTPAAPAAVQPVPPQPTPTPQPTPVTPPPVTPPAEKPAVPEAAPPAAATPSASAAAAPVPGSGGGTGADGTTGSGPGTGGGLGSGIGTGRGAGVGPGTGGGNAVISPPVATELPLPPLPVPSRIQGTEILVVFDVDSTGRVLRFDFEPTRDGGYNRKLRDVLGSVRFRAATRPDGQPVRSQASIKLLL